MKSMYRILIVDDDQAILDMLKLQLEWAIFRTIPPAKTHLNVIGFPAAKAENFSFTR